LVLFGQTKRTLIQATKRFAHDALTGLRPVFKFFCLDTKEPKDQECRIASGRHSAPRSWVMTLQTALSFLEKQEPHFNPPNLYR